MSLSAPAQLLLRRLSAADKRLDDVDAGESDPGPYSPIEILEESYDVIAPMIPDIVSRMYARLFEVNPRALQIFEGKDSTLQRRTVQVLREAFEDFRPLIPELEALGVRHAEWGVTQQDYAVMGPLLLESMAAAADPYWLSAYTTVWAALWEVVEDIMVRGAAQAQAAALATDA